MHQVLNGKDSQFQTHCKSDKIKTLKQQKTKTKKLVLLLQYSATMQNAIK